ncbi:MAG: hypothetical protein IKI73_04640 [Firmicutes bacterium]|nr:hypothetical protein [Bacillota bacterium]MBR6237344.1 hypothetical protein [Bacillota bacterium]
MKKKRRPLLKILVFIVLAACVCYGFYYFVPRKVITADKIHTIVVTDSGTGNSKADFSEEEIQQLKSILSGRRIKGEPYSDYLYSKDSIMIMIECGHDNKVIDIMEILIDGDECWVTKTGDPGKWQGYRIPGLSEKVRALLWEK